MDKTNTTNLEVSKLREKNRMLRESNRWIKFNNAVLSIALLLLTGYIIVSSVNNSPISKLFLWRAQITNIRD